MSEEVQENRLTAEAGRIARMTRVGMACNLGLAALKLVVGKLSGSIALLADGANSLSDVVTDIAVLVGTGLGSRPADDNHPFGHGKLETFVAGSVSLGVFGVGVGIVWSAIHGFITPHPVPRGQWMMIVAALTILTKELLFRATRKVARESRSAALNAKAWDHRSDVFVSAMVFVGGVGALMGWDHADGIAGTAVGLVIVAVGAKLTFEVLRELTEATAGDEVFSLIGQVLGEFSDVRGWHRLRVRRLGRELHMDVHLVIDPDITVREGHDIVLRIENAIQERLTWPVNLVIHVDPEHDADGVAA